MNAGATARDLALVLILCGCTSGNSGRDANEMMFAAAAPPAQRPKPDPKVGQKTPQPYPKPPPQPNSQPKAPDPRGSGDAIPVAAQPGAVIGGFADAVWADRDNDGSVDGYIVNGQYYTGIPGGYDSELRSLNVAGMGAIISGLSVIEGAQIGAAVGGIAGAIWADRDNDGRVDGYVSNGQYYQGAPAAASPTPAYAPPDGRSGERG